MLINQMKPEECRELLARVGFGRLACARDNQPYIVPIYFAYEADRLYGFATFGQKIEWMRSNRLVSVEADEIINQNNWSSVIITGRYEELPDTVEYADQRKQAQLLLENRSLWWQTGYVVAQIRGQRKAPLPILYSIRIQEITGLRAIPGESANSQIFWED